MKRILFYDRISLLKKSANAENLFLPFTIFKRYLLENGVGSEHIIEIALDGNRERGIKRSQDAFLISKASRYDIKGGICMKRNYWALLVFALIIVLQ